MKYTVETRGKKDGVLERFTNAIGGDKLVLMVAIIVNL